MRVAACEVGVECGLARREGEGSVVSALSAPPCAPIRRPDANAESFDADGFYKTGDIGYVDEDGLYYVVDRVKELIKVKGFQVPPAELEAALMGFDAIADAAVIGLPCEKHGELPKAYVVKQVGYEDLTANDVSGYLIGKVAEYKQV